MHNWRTLALVLALLGVVLASCAEETTPAVLLGNSSTRVTAGEATDASAPTAPSAPRSEGPKGCVQAVAEPLPARLVAMSAQAATTSNLVFVDDLYTRFSSSGSCGGCHSGTAMQGGFNVSSPQVFKAAFSAGPNGAIPDALARMTSDDAARFMPPPPNGVPYSARLGKCDDVEILAEMITQWIGLGRPDSFSPDATVCNTPPISGTSGTDGGSGGGSANAFALTVVTGNAMTNIGWCVPGAGSVATESATSARLDAQFASYMADPTGDVVAQLGLPADLSQTDLFTLDAAALAPYGVVAYAPTYPLWSDNAGKLRFIRVPRGTSIHFDKATQKFEIPPNTRFYKTFMKQIVDTDGSYRWRKMETRLIVSRPDAVDPDGTHHPTALFGTYQWNDGESVATLVTTKLRNQTPFADTVVQYNTDEPLAHDILSNPSGDPSLALIEGHAARHYAIPGSQRCIQCHMGSPDASFVLGFTPLQIARRPAGQGGVIEPAGRDELTQLQRFIDYGLITGIASASDILPLESSQSPRAPRNDQELIAQGYLLGNCAHCHNPIGYPTVQNPNLRNVLNFLPSAGQDGGGVFQFPLERYSPRIYRGPTGTTPIPYLTPSLFDLPDFDSHGAPLGDDLASGGVYAPWRSLIYRNTENAFAYTDTSANVLYPHMPFNTPGYDPRLKQIVSDWMVSIPAVRKHPEIPEGAYFGDPNADTLVDESEQPYVEVFPSDARYASALRQAQARLSILHTGVNPQALGSTPYSRYGDPDVTDDILDPDVQRDPICHPIPVGDTVTPYHFPRHPHWVETDFTDQPPPYAPRRTDWANILVERAPPPSETACSGLKGQDQAQTDQLTAIDLLQNVTFDDSAASADPFVAYAKTPLPFGLWQATDATCATKLAAEPHVSDFDGSAGHERPHWMDVANPAADAPVYEQTPGEAVFKMICINCHGPLADGNGRIANNLAIITGGHARVANFHAGLFGPPDFPGSNRSAIFGIDVASLASDAGTSGDAAAIDGGSNPAAWSSVPADVRAARYMAWMALGGTQVAIPQAILQLVAETKILGETPRDIPALDLSANMLSVGKTICRSMLGSDGYGGTQGSAGQLHVTEGYLQDVYKDGAHHPLLNRLLRTANGDAELWLRLCTENNPAPVHVLAMDDVGISQQIVFDVESGALQTPDHLIARAAYPPGSPVGNDRGGVDCSLDGPGDGGVAADNCLSPTQDNRWPWCVNVGGSPAFAAQADQMHLPKCPPNPTDASWMTDDDAERWMVRGAINAALVVFLYLEDLETTGRRPDYNECQLLP